MRRLKLLLPLEKIEAPRAESPRILPLMDKSLIRPTAEIRRSIPNETRLNSRCEISRAKAD